MLSANGLGSRIAMHFDKMEILAMDCLVLMKRL